MYQRRGLTPTEQNVISKHESFKQGRTGLWYLVFQPLKRVVPGPETFGAWENSSALQGRWPEGPEGFPAHAVIPHGAQKGRYDPHGEQNGHYGRRMAHKRVVTPLWA